MRKILLAGLLTTGLLASAFDVHFYKDGGNEASTISNATKIVFSAEQTIVTDIAGTDQNITNSSFAYMGFTASSGIKVITENAEARITVDGNKLSVSSSQVSTIEVFSLSGNLAAKATNSNTCDISTLSRGTYIVRVNADGGISISKIFKQF